MRTQAKYVALFLLAAAAVSGCANEPDDESTGLVEAPPAATESTAEESSDDTNDLTFESSNKALRDHYCCALKKNEVTRKCVTIYATKAGAKLNCASMAAGSTYNGHALRDNRCSNYSDCLAL
jgi:hypothetical protein